MSTVVEAPTQSVDRSLFMSYEAYRAWVGETAMAEWVDGEVIVFMPLKRIHQELVGFLYALLRAFVDYHHAGKVLMAPFEMRLSHSAREPDILFVAQEHLSRLAETRLEGPADLVVEVISDDSERRDRVDKFNEYMEAGVREYWVIDPRSGRKQADFWVMDEQGRYLAARVDEAGAYHSSVLNGFWLRVDWLWQDPHPNVQLLFAEMVGLSDEVKRAFEGG
ncbi:MAG: Uma2 family endonuclease [Chloroflexi bacterium]|nr:Uma2 family endonuclease [Chloroflexota bacterium]